MEIEPTFEAELGKWGNSAAIRVPKWLTKAARMNTGDKLKVRVEVHYSARGESENAVTTIWASLFTNNTNIAIIPT